MGGKVVAFTKQVKNVWIDFTQFKQSCLTCKYGIFTAKQLYLAMLSGMEGRALVHLDRFVSM